MAVEDNGWRCHARSERDGAPIEIDDGDIVDVQTHPDTFTLSDLDKKRKASVRNSRIFFNDAPNAFRQAIVVASLNNQKINLSETKRRILLLRPRQLPTDEIYVQAPLAQMCSAGLCELIVVDTTLQHPDANLFRDVNMVVVVRYISAEWMDALAKCKARAFITYLFDDDIPSAVDTIELPATYRRRLVDVTSCEFQYMLYISDIMVVSSPALAKRFNSPKTHLLEPPSIRESESLDHHLDSSPLRIGYHGSNTHYRDLEFLTPVIKKFSKANPDVEFDLFGHKGIREMVRGFGQINVMDPLPWEEYKDFVRKRPCHIMVAPLLDHAYNGGKSRIKFCDASSLGAAGIFTDNPIYRAIVDDGVDGLLVSNTEDDWLGALQSLAGDPDRVHRMASACRLTNQQKCSLSEATRFWAELLNVDVRL
ncbi:hypothetical protein [Mesorhizobium sp. CN2-181]|uniref:hypothetical protein n=1 Tax=Mesorhizobium yinganensis TaxID=3157707 RepID=UPI0032B8102E